MATKFELMESSFSPVNMTSPRFYFPSVPTIPMFPYSCYYGGYASPEMSSPLLVKDIGRVWPGFVSPCYHPSFQGIPHQGVDEEKPTQSYIGLIGKAILSSPQQKLVLGDIYNYILTNYPYFRNKGPGWRNSIRHNLSLNDCFVKLGRSPNGKGHFWAINPLNYEDFSRGEYKRKRATRRNRDRKEGASEMEMNAANFTNCTSREMHCSTDTSRNVTAKRGFHIERLLSDKWEDMSSSKTQDTMSVFTVEPQGQLSAKQQLALNRLHQENLPSKLVF